ncbi:MAG: hypothetical protein ACRDKL_05580, partial [Solirubrobacteraceae bacterium]
MHSTRTAPVAAARWSPRFAVLTVALLFVLAWAAWAPPRAAADSIYWMTANAYIGGQGVEGPMTSSFTCASASVCITSGYGDTYHHVGWESIITNLTSANGTWESIDSSQVTGNMAPSVPAQASDCPTQSECILAGGDDYAVSANITSPTPAWTSNAMYPASYSGSEDPSALSCVGVTICLAADQAGNILTTTDVTSGQPWTVTSIDTPSGQAGILNYLSCSPDGLCLAADQIGDVYVDPDVTSDPTDWSEVTVESGQNVTGVSCPSASLCLLTDDGGRVWVSTDPSQAGSWSAATLTAAGAEATGVSCSSTQLCVVIDSAGDAFTSFAPAAKASSWSEDGIDAPYALSSVSCSPQNACVASDGTNVFIGTTTLLGEPSVTTTPGTATGTTATLTGAVDPDDDPVTACSFTWAASAQQLTSSLASAPINCSPSVGDGTAPVDVSAEITGLTKGTTSYYVITATNSYGTVSSSIGQITTTGSAAPTIDAYGGDYDFSTDQLTWNVTINPHNSTGVSVQAFYVWDYPENPYPPQCTQPSSYPISDRSNEVQVPSGTNETGVLLSANPEPPTGATILYCIVVSYDNGGYTFTSQLEVDAIPPPPVNVTTPYLQENGYDADAGYQLLCQPGAWSGGGGTYQFRWLKLYDGVVLGPPPGQVSQTNLPGDTYSVTSVDIGTEIACEARAQAPAVKDGYDTEPPAWSPWVMSNATIPQGSNTQLFLPGWLKTVFEADVDAGDVDTVVGLLTADGPLETCLVEAELGDVVPGLGLGLCAGTLFLYVAQDEATSMIEDQVDPPDRHYTQLGLPPTPRRVAARCPHGLAKRSCRRYLRAVHAYTVAQSQLSSAISAMLTTGNRYLNAKDRGNQNTEFLQRAAVEVDMGYAAHGLQAEAKAASAYVHLLLKAHLRGGTANRLTLARFLRGPLARAVEHKGLTRAQLDRILAPTWRSLTSKRANLASLKRVQSPAKFLRAYHLLDLADLGAILQQLDAQYALPAATVKTLEGDLT